MDYQVWIKNEYEESYTKVDCGDLPAAKREIDKAVRNGGEPILTVSLPYELSIKVSEVPSEVTKSKAQPDKSPGVKSDSQVRRGDEADTKRLDKGSGDSGAGDRAGDRG